MFVSKQILRAILLTCFFSIVISFNFSSKVQAQDSVTIVMGDCIPLAGNYGYFVFGFYDYETPPLEGINGAKLQLFSNQPQYQHDGLHLTSNGFGFFLFFATLDKWKATLTVKLRAGHAPNPVLADDSIDLECPPPYF